MKRSLILTVLSLIVTPFLSPGEETAAQHDQRMAWFRDARFGLFIHWGVYSVPAGEWNGHTNYGEWFLEETKMPVSQYEKFAGQFNPVRFDAKEWVRLAKNAGMNYIVITSKHHDGFGMFRSDQTDWCIKSTPFQRDPLKELADACKQAGIKLCFYHSIMDWHHPDWGKRRAWNDKATGTPDMDRYTAYMKAQLKELLTRYGPLGIMWFDGEWENPWTHERGVDLYHYVRGLQPNIIINNRVGKARAGMEGMDKGAARIGDYGTPEQQIPATGFGPGVDWESCMTMNNHWGYNKNDQNWKSATTLVRNLIDCSSKGGNYLLNIGPTSEGVFPPACVERLEQIGKWMKCNGEAIYGTQASPFESLSWGRCTQKKLASSTTDDGYQQHAAWPFEDQRRKSGRGQTRLYFFVYDWPADGRLVIPGLANQPVRAFLLEGRRPLSVTAANNTVSISVPTAAPDACASVVALDIQGAPQIIKPDPYADETPAQRDARMAWWRAARFGMFIHWGVYSVPAGTYKGEQIKGIGEWIMNRGKIPMAEYRAFAKEFNPVKFDADEWVRTAKEAGMKYIVITSKHHDGFAMFDSKASDWNIIKASPFGRDPLQELAAACRKYGLKLGFYYSQAQDWNNGGSAAGGKWDPAQEHSMDDYIDKVAVPQVKEILTHYGEFPAVLWWDTSIDMNKDRADKLITLLKVKPGIIHNNRLGGGYKGDTETPEQFIPATGYPGRDWETCMTMNDTWGFKSYDDHWKSTAHLIRNLVDIASKGGNYLLNVGPTSEGLIPAPSVERLKEVGQWMKVNGVAIYDTSASPFKRLPWGRCTKKLTPDGAILYLHVFNWPEDGKLVVSGLKNITQEAYVLSDPAKQGLAMQSGAEGLILSVPSAAPDPVSSTIVLKVKGALVVEQTGLAQDYDGSLVLPAGEARLHGKDIKYMNDGHRDDIAAWTNPADWVSWEFKVTRPGKFDVTAETAALEKASLQVAVGDSQTDGTAAATGDYGKFKVAKLGTLEISAAGKVTLAVRPVKDGWHPVNLKSVRLKPAASE
jgi:alpha-L-fucosidase